MCVCLSVCLSRFYGLYLGYYGSDFDETWWKCWNLDPIDCIKISLRYAARAFSLRAKRVIGQRGKIFFLHFFAFQSISSRLRHIFFSKIFMSAKRKTRASKASVLVRLIVSKFHKKKSFSAIILCMLWKTDSCGRAILSSYFISVALVSLRENDTLKLVQGQLVLHDTVYHILMYCLYVMHVWPNSKVKVHHICLYIHCNMYAITCWFEYKYFIIISDYLNYDKCFSQ